MAGRDRPAESGAIMTAEKDDQINVTEHDLPVTEAMIAAAEKLIGLELTNDERELMLDKVNKSLDRYQKLRAVTLNNDQAPALYFNPTLRGGAQAADAPPDLDVPLEAGSGPLPSLPANLEDLAFYPVTELARLVKARQVTSTALTEMYLARLKRYGPPLECVVTLTEDLASTQAKQADAEIAAGRYRGPLHGIPFGAKDLLATKGIPTTWGAMPFKDQVIDEDATVVRRLNQAGAVLVAKLSMGALAWGDVWFGGKTKNPWNIEHGSSGSSAGSGAATAAGLVGFAIGTETYGSIVSPSTICGLTGLRPTFGRVSRAGAMALSWSMDKIGPMCRSVADCALVFAAIQGSDGQDPTVVEQPFTWNPNVKLADLRFGYVENGLSEDHPHRPFYEQTLDTLRMLGANLRPIKLPDYPLEPLQLILEVEAAAAFDELTRSNVDDLLVRQEEEAWPNLFRQARFIPAVEYVQANRVRALVMQALSQLMADVDLYVAPSLEGDNLLLTNLTGHPAVVVPNGFDEEGMPTSITFTGRLYDESTILAVAKSYQDATDFSS